ncbi:MAG: DUF433 domain-containing protein [Desulfurellales bacterium]|nr:MAG: DUF433 domain-containing protein [Desulfurellales bacterium]
MEVGNPTGRSLWTVGRTQGLGPGPGGVRDSHGPPGPEGMRTLRILRTLGGKDGVRCMSLGNLCVFLRRLSRFSLPHPYGALSISCGTMNGMEALHAAKPPIEAARLAIAGLLICGRGQVLVEAAERAALGLARGNPFPQTVRRSARRRALAARLSACLVDSLTTGRPLRAIELRRGIVSREGLNKMLKAGGLVALVGETCMPLELAEVLSRRVVDVIDAVPRVRCLRDAQVIMRAVGAAETITRLQAWQHVVDTGSCATMSLSTIDQGECYHRLHNRMSSRDSKRHSSRNSNDTGAYPLYEAAHYLRVPYSTARAWSFGQHYRTHGKTRRFLPIIQIADAKQKLLSFNNLVELHLLNGIRRIHQIPLSKIRSSLLYVEKTLETPRPLLNQAFLTDGLALFVERSGMLVNVSEEGQISPQKLIEPYMNRIERDASGIPIRLYPFSRHAGQEDSKSIVIDPTIAFGRPVLVGTGVPTANVFQRFLAGEPIDELARDFDMESALIEEAIRCENASSAA